MSTTPTPQAEKLWTAKSFSLNDHVIYRGIVPMYNIEFAERYSVNGYYGEERSIKEVDGDWMKSNEVLPYLSRLEEEKELWVRTAGKHLKVVDAQAELIAKLERGNKELKDREEKLSKAIRIARGTLGYGELETEPETILQVRTVLDSALTNK